MSLLVVVNGPIASGKSTVARLLGVSLRAAGRSVAVLDIDDVVDTIGGFGGLAPERFSLAQQVHGELVGAWLRRGLDVIAHGPFFERREHDALRHAVPDDTTVLTVLLLATYEVALERVAADPDRQLSKHPLVLRRTYDRAESLLSTLPPSDWTFDSETIPPTAIADAVATAIQREHQ